MNWRGHWVRVYRARIALRLERCRGCNALPGGKGGTRRFTLDHLVPASRGGTSAMANATILCEGCNTRKAAEDAPEHWVSLAEEEAAAPPELRWSQHRIIPEPPPPTPPKPAKVRKVKRPRHDPAAAEREARKRAERWGRSLRGARA